MGAEWERALHGTCETESTTCCRSVRNAVRLPAGLAHSPTRPPYPSVSMEALVEVQNEGVAFPRGLEENAWAMLPNHIRFL